MVEQKPSRGVTGALIKLWRGGEYQLTVTGRTEITPNYLRLHFIGKELLDERPVHPTMWVRGWFPDGAKSHQRGYTLVNVDQEVGTLDIDFAMHDGLATRWARAAEPGDTLEVTVLGSNFTVPEPTPAGYVIVGDSASLPAINSLLDAVGNTPATVLLESSHDDDRELPVATGDVTWVDRKNAGEALVEAVKSSAFDAADHFGWVACDNRTTRAVARVLREDYKIPRKSIKAQAYWVG
jgi:NADPH-dependent ferric siderophore reductase